MIEGPATGLLPAKPWGCSQLFPVPEHRHLQENNNVSLDCRAETFHRRPRRSLASNSSLRGHERRRLDL
jgi:hypothetical protein